MKDQYFKVVERKKEYLGERYFRFSYSAEKVVRVCLTTGDIKKGKSNTFGVYLIHRMTLFTNYMAMNYIQPCTKREFEKQFDKVVKMLR